MNTRLPLLCTALVLASCIHPNSDSAEATGEGAATSIESDTREALTAISSEGARRTRVSRALSVDAMAFAEEHATRAGVSTPRFAERSTHTDVDGLTHVRLEQRHLVGGEELPVWGADLVVHASDKEVTGLAGSVATDLANRLAPATRAAAVTEAQALTLAKRQHFGARATSVTTDRDATERVVFLDKRGTPHVAVHTSFYTELVPGFSPGLIHHMFDETTGDLLAKWNALDTLVQASGPGGNEKFHNTWTEQLDVEPQGGQYVMTTTRLQTKNSNHSTSPFGTGAEIVAALDGFTDPAANDAHGYAEVTLSMLKDWMNRDSIDDRGYRIVSRVHYGNNYENAFWNGSMMTYGDGGAHLYPICGAIDAVAHEIHHGFTEKHSGLGYRGEAGGLNEGFSDIAGKTVEFYYRGDATTWDIGTSVFKADGSLRYMCDPKKDGRSIDHASQMTAGIDPHLSSGVPNKAFCRLSKRLSSGDAEGSATATGVHRAASAFFLANASYWTGSSTFKQACQGTVDAARSLQFTEEEIAAMKSSWADVGVYCDGATPAPTPATPPPATR